MSHNYIQWFRSLGCFSNISRRDLLFTNAPFQRIFFLKDGVYNDFRAILWNLVSSFISNNLLISDSTQIFFFLTLHCTQASDPFSSMVPQVLGAKGPKSASKFCQNKFFWCHWRTLYMSVNLKYPRVSLSAKTKFCLGARTHYGVSFGSQNTQYL